MGREDVLFGVGKRHLKGYLVPLGVCLLIPPYIVSTVYVGTIQTFFLFPIVLALLAIIYYSFKDKLQGSAKPRNNVDDQIQRQYLKGSSWRNNKFVLYLLIITVLFVVSYVGFMVFEKGIFLLGFIVSGLLFVLAFLGKYFHSEVFDEHSYRDDHNPHIREWKDKLKKP